LVFAESQGIPKDAPAVPLPSARVHVVSGQSSLHAFRVGVGVVSALVIIGGLIGTAGIRNPARVVQAKHYPGGQLAVHRSTPRGTRLPASEPREG
jgi:hypothetical protein